MLDWIAILYQWGGFLLAMWISYFLSSRNRAWTIGDLVQNWCLSLGMWSEPLYLMEIGETLENAV